MVICTENYFVVINDNYEGAVELWLARWTSDLKVGYPPAVCRRYPFYTPGWRETMWGKVFCLRKQHDDKDWASKGIPNLRVW